MFKLSIVVIVVGLACSEQVNAGELQNLDPFTWNNRVILINATQSISPIDTQMDNLFDEIEDRDIVWFEINKENIISNYQGEIGKNFRHTILQKYFLDRDQKVKLIGKDGNVKASYSRFDLDAIFSLIDTMPMRQLEMKESKYE